MKNENIVQSLVYPSGSEAYFQYASTLHFAYRPEEAIPMFQKVIRLKFWSPKGDVFSA